MGVAGRTGCGKSTLMMALKRVMEPSGGRILIDGVDIAAVPLFHLRSRLALVPQACSSTLSCTTLQNLFHIPVLRRGRCDWFDPYEPVASIFQTCARSFLGQGIGEG